MKTNQWRFLVAWIVTGAIFGVAWVMSLLFMEVFGLDVGMVPIVVAFNASTLVRLGLER